MKTNKETIKNIALVCLVVLVLVFVITTAFLGVKVNEQKVYNMAYINTVAYGWKYIPISDYTVIENYIQIIDLDGSPLLVNSHDCILFYNVEAFEYYNNVRIIYLLF